MVHNLVVLTKLNNKIYFSKKSHYKFNQNQNISPKIQICKILYKNTKGNQTIRLNRNILLKANTFLLGCYLSCTGKNLF